MFDAESCQALWRIPSSTIGNPQHVAAAQLDPSSPLPVVAIEERGSEQAARTFIVSPQGRVLARARQGDLTESATESRPPMAVRRLAGGPHRQG